MELGGLAGWLSLSSTTVPYIQMSVTLKPNSIHINVTYKLIFSSTIKSYVYNLNA